MPKPRRKDNKKLPKYWRFHENRYRYRVPPHLRERHGGKTEITLGATLYEAYRTWAEFHHHEEIGEETITTMGGLLDRYIRDVVPEHASANTRKSKIDSIGRLRHVLGSNKLYLITPQVIYKYRDHIGQEKSKKYANLDLEVLSHCFTKAIEWGLVSDHPMTNKKVVKFSLKGRDRYVEDWELREWASVANPFLVVYVVLKGVTGLRQQDLLTLKMSDISEDELQATSLKTGKIVRFPLWARGKKPTTVKLALDLINDYYGNAVPREWVFQNRKGTSYYNLEKRQASGFHTIWRRSMDRALEQTRLAEKFTEHDIRAKVGSDANSDLEAQKLLAHSNAALTVKHYRRRGVVVDPAKGFSL